MLQILSFQLEIEWCNFSTLTDKLLVSYFNRLTEQLVDFYPELKPPTFKRLDESIVHRVPSYLVSLIPGSIPREEFSDLAKKRLFVLCEPDDWFVEPFQLENELAHWGVAIPRRIAIAWEPREFLIWHETLHLLNAKDCYNKFGINKCTNGLCLMRRSPTRDRCGNRLMICSKNVKRIQVDYQEELALNDFQNVG